MKTKNASPKSFFALLSTLFVAILSFGSFTLAQVTDFLSLEDQKKAAAIEADLTQLGFDLPKLIAEAQKKNRLSPSEIQDIQARNILVEKSKKIASIIMARIEPKLASDEKTLDRYIELATRLLVSGIPGLPEKFPAEIQNIQSQMEKEAKANAFLQEYITRSINQTRADLIGDFASLIYSAQDIQKLNRTTDKKFLAEKNSLTDAVDEVVTAMYADLRNSQSHLLGRALTYTLLRFAKQNNRQDISSRLATELRKKGEYLENITTDQFIALDEERVVNHRLRNGELLYVKKAPLRKKDFKEDFNELFSNFTGKSKFTTTGQVVIFENKALGIQNVMMISLKPDVRFSDMSGFASKGITQTITRNGLGAEPTVLYSDKVSSDRRRLVLFYGDTRFPMDTAAHLLANQNLAPMKISNSIIKDIADRALISEEFQSLLLAPSAIKQTEKIQAQNVINFPGQKARLQTEDEMRSFLVELGFQDLSKEILDYYKEGKTYNQHTQTQQFRNAKSYQMINSSRELAILIMSKIQTQLTKKESQKEIYELVAYLLSQQPINLVKKVPNEIFAAKEETEQKKLVDRYTDQMLRSSMSYHARVMSSDIMQYLFGSEKLDLFTAGKLTTTENMEIEETVFQINKYLTNIIDRMYLDVQIGQTRFLGRAFLALLAKYSENNQLNLIEEAKPTALKYGLRLDNFLGDTLLLDDDKDKAVKIPVKNFAYVLTRNISPESVTIPWGSIPEDFERAKKRNLIGSLVAFPFVVTPEAAKDGYGYVDRIREKIFYRYKNNGYSHIGYAFIKKASNSNIKMTWMMDNYPHVVVDTDDVVENAKHNAGGLRFVGLEQFFMGSHHSRIYITNPDEKLFFEHAQNEIRKKGMPKTGSDASIFPSYRIKLDETGLPVKQKEEELQRDDWTLETSQNELDELYSIQDPKIFHQKYTALIEKGFFENLKRGMTFVWITPYGQYYKGTGYCSSTSDIIARQFTGITLEPKKSKWREIVHITSKLNETALAKKIGFIQDNEDIQNIAMFSKLGIIAPSSLANQDYMTDYWSVVAPAKEVGERTLDDWSYRLAKNEKTLRLVEKILPSKELTYFAYKKFDPTEVRAVSYELMHREEVRNGVLGIKRAAGE